MAGNIREADDIRAVRKRVSKARNFPTNTCPWSRHAQLIGEAMAKGREWGGEEDRKHCGESILTTVASLYEARTKIEALEAERDALREALGHLLHHAKAAAFSGFMADDDVEVCNLRAAIDQAIQGTKG